MKQLKKDAAMILVWKIRCLFVVVLAVLFFLFVSYEKQRQAYQQEPVPFEALWQELQENPNLQTQMYYTELEIPMITGSYGEYGRTEKELPDAVYYLMPIQDGTKLLSILAPQDYIEQLDAMEQAFYESIGSEKKQYQEPITVKGSLRPLQEDEQGALQAYFLNHDQKDMETMSIPYIFTIDEIDHVRVAFLEHIPMYYTILILLLVASGLGSIPFITLHRLYHKCQDLAQECIDNDYKKAYQYENFKLGESYFYQKKWYTMDLFSYRDILWMYQDETKKKIHLYLTDGICILLPIGKDVAAGKRAYTTISKQAKYAIQGYDKRLEEFWNKDKKQFKEGLKKFGLYKDKGVKQ